MFDFVQKLQYFIYLEPFQESNFLDELKKSAHILSVSLSTLF